MANEQHPLELRISKDIKESTFNRLAAHIYLLISLLLEKEIKESNLLKLGKVLAFSSILLELCSIIFSAFWEIERSLKKLIVIYSFVNIWIILNLFVMMHMKPHDSLDNITCWIFLTCLILSAIYFTCVHVCNKEPFSYFRRKKKVSTNSNRNKPSFFANPKILYIEPSHFATISWLFILSNVQVAADKPSIFRTFSIFLCLISGLAIFNGYFYTLRGFGRISKRLSHAFLWFPLFNGVFYLILLLSTHTSHSSEIFFGIFGSPIVLMGIYILCLLIFDKDPLSYFKKKKDINDGSKEPSVCEVV